MITVVKESTISDTSTHTLFEVSGVVLAHLLVGEVIEDIEPTSYGSITPSFSAPSVSVGGGSVASGTVVKGTYVTSVMGEGEVITLTTTTDFTGGRVRWTLVYEQVTTGSSVVASEE